MSSSDSESDCPTILEEAEAELHYSLLKTIRPILEKYFPEQAPPHMPRAPELTPFVPDKVFASVAQLELQTSQLKTQNKNLKKALKSLKSSDGRAISTLAKFLETSIKSISSTLEELNKIISPYKKGESGTSVAEQNPNSNNFNISNSSNNSNSSNPRNQSSLKQSEINSSSDDDAFTESTGNRIEEPSILSEDDENDSSSADDSFSYQNKEKESQSTRDTNSPQQSISSVPKHPTSKNVSPTISKPRLSQTISTTEEKYPSTLNRSPSPDFEKNPVNSHSPRGTSFKKPVVEYSNEQLSKMEKCIARWPYNSQRPDELNLQKDDLVHIISKENPIDPSWWLGVLDRTRKSGRFPYNYVQIVNQIQSHSSVVPSFATIQQQQQQQKSSAGSLSFGVSETPSIISGSSPSSLNANVEDSFGNQILKTWLYKKGASGHKFKNWKRRFCVLRDRQILYYKQPTDNEPLASLPLRHVKIKRDSSKFMSDKDSKAYPHSFLVIMPKKSYVFASKNLREIDSWFDALQDQTEL